MMPNIIKEVQHELISYNWEERVFFFIATVLSVGLVINSSIL